MEHDRYAQMAVDHGIEDDDPVLGEPDMCVDCKKLGTEIPVSTHPGDAELRCEPCWIISEEFNVRHVGDCGPDSEEIFFDFHLEVGVRVKDHSPLELRRARLRAYEVLLGTPMVDDQETWESELVSVHDQENEEIDMPNGDDLA